MFTYQIATFWKYENKKLPNAKIAFPRCHGYVNTQFSNFVIECLPENQKVSKTILACLCGAQVQSFKQKIVKKSRETVPLNGNEKGFWKYSFFQG